MVSQFFVEYKEKESLKVTIASVWHIEIELLVNGSSNVSLPALGDGCTRLCITQLDLLLLASK